MRHPVLRDGNSAVPLSSGTARSGIGTSGSVKFQQGKRDLCLPYAGANAVVAVLRRASQSTAQSLMQLWRRAAMCASLSRRWCRHRTRARSVGVTNLLQERGTSRWGELTQSPERRSAHATFSVCGAGASIGDFPNDV